MKLKLFLTTALAILLFPVVVLAADFSIRLGQPKTPTNQNNFKLTFVALDTQTDRNITVKCFKKGPSDGGFSQFDTDKVMIPGGNTDTCDVTSSLLSANGTYSFYVTATADSTTLTSSTVTVDFNTSGPSTPVSYSKERLNSCDYKIKFKTANDGKTAKVQLFRSDTLSITVNNDSVIASQNIGPDQEGEFTNSVPTCGKDYYYVIRAVDSAGNVSGTKGDSFTTTTTTTTSTTTQTGSTGALVIDGTSSSQVSPENGSQTSPTASTSATSTDESVTPSSDVLGTATDGGWSFKKWFFLILASFVLYFILRSLKRAK